MKRIRITVGPEGAWYKNRVGHEYPVIEVKSYGVVVDELRDVAQYWVEHGHYEEIERIEG